MSIRHIHGRRQCAIPGKLTCADAKCQPPIAIIWQPFNALSDHCAASVCLWLDNPLLGLGRFFSFLIFFTQSVGLLGRGTSPSQGRYLNTGQHKHRINTHTDIHTLSGIRTLDASVRASEDSSCLRPRGHYDRQVCCVTGVNNAWSRNRWFEIWM
jgi:hypothetical protein